jgi:glycosyltransferase involved in cell wall biosynthesis
MDPRGGGVSEGVLRLRMSLAQAGYDGDLLTLDMPDAPFIKALQQAHVEVHALGPSRGTYAYNPNLLPWLRLHAYKYDAIIVNGLWQYPGLAILRSMGDKAPPYFVFPHGMLDPWFKRRYPLKHLKKWMYWLFAEYRVLRNASAVLFTCEEEKLVARESFWLYKCNEAVVSYGTSEPPQDEGRLSALFLDAYPDLRGKRLALFLGRIHEKKGCDLLVEAFAQTAKREPDIHLIMAGPDQEGWAAALQRRAADLGVADRISWPGMLSGDLKWGAFFASEVFCLPSHQENFGIAVAEALACSRPVLISDKVNIWREVKDDRAGFVESDSAAGCERMLSSWLETAPCQMAAMKVAARQCFEDRFRIERVAQNLIRVIREHTGSATPVIVRSARDAEA